MKTFPPQLTNHCDDPYDGCMFTFSSAHTQEVKTKLYDMIKTIERGVEGYEIQSRDSKSVLVINNQEFESLLETLDIVQACEQTDEIKITTQQDMRIRKPRDMVL